jgi:uncharacterized membrane-anchored protein YhcB (DUF1043 family)
MSDELPPPSPVPAPRANASAVIALATFVIVLAVGAAAYLLHQEMQAMQASKPQAPPQITAALKDLRSTLEQQRNDNAAQLQSLKAEMEALKQEQQTAGSSPDLAPMQEKLDAIAAKLEQQEAAEKPDPAPSATTAPETSSPVHALDDYLALYQVVRASKPYKAELTRLLPSLADVNDEAVTTLQEYADSGISSEEALSEEWHHITEQTMSESSDENTDSTLPHWMQAVNSSMGGLVKIRRADEANASDAEDIATLDDMERMVKELPEKQTEPYGDWLDKLSARRDVLDALSIIESSLSRGA